MMPSQTTSSILYVLELRQGPFLFKVDKNIAKLFLARNIFHVPSAVKTGKRLTLQDIVTNEENNAARKSLNTLLRSTHEKYGGSRTPGRFIFVRCLATGS